PPAPPVAHCQPLLVQAHIAVLRPGHRHRVGTPVPGEQTHCPPEQAAADRKSPHVSTVAPLPGRQKTVPSLGVHAPAAPAAPPPPPPAPPLPALDPPTLDPPAPGPPSGCSGVLPQLPALTSALTAAQSSKRRSIPCAFGRFIASPKSANHVPLRESAQSRGESWRRRDIAVLSAAGCRRRFGLVLGDGGRRLHRLQRGDARTDRGQVRAAIGDGRVAVHSQLAGVD